MKIKFIYITIILFALFQEVCEAQLNSKNSWKSRRKIISFGIGATNFLGDLGGANQNGTNGIKDFNFPAIRPDANVGFLYRLTNSIDLKTNLIFAELAGNDKYTKSPYRNDRNCNFRAPVIEFSEQLDYSLLNAFRSGHRYKLSGVKGMNTLGFDLYIFAGIGVFFYNPQGQYLDNKWYGLKPLCTEGEGLVSGKKKYSLFQASIPFGIGFKYAIDKDWSIGIEYGIRKTFTDYIDDVSTVYADPIVLAAENGPIAAKLADRSIVPAGETPNNTGLHVEIQRPKIGILLPDLLFNSGLSQSMKLALHTRNIKK